MRKVDDRKKEKEKRENNVVLWPLTSLPVGRPTLVPKAQSLSLSTLVFSREVLCYSIFFYHLNLN